MKPLSPAFSLVGDAAAEIAYEYINPDGDHATEVGDKIKALGENTDT